MQSVTATVGSNLLKVAESAQAMKVDRKEVSDSVCMRNIACLSRAAAISIYSLPFLHMLMSAQNIYACLAEISVLRAPVSYVSLMWRLVHKSLAARHAKVCLALCASLFQA